LSDLHAKSLIELGAIYLNKKRCMENCLLEPDDYLRVHLKPKRFKTPQDLSKCIFDDLENFVVALKPCGLPSIPSLDNARENLHKLLEAHLNSKLYPVHRLDVETSGLILFAKNKESAKEFGKIISSGDFHKSYLAFSKSQLAPGIYTHYLKAGQSPPFQLSNRKESNDDKECRLEVLSSQKQDCSKSFLMDATLYPQFKELGDAFLHQVQLYTGRTHQIRAQFSNLNAPLIGDHLYGDKTNLEVFALQSHKIWFKFRSESYQFEYTPTEKACATYV
ncbi:MAG: pseudouridine synthase, partial [Bdellovibrionota bacterium]|nr:pseudouridine synthase [Bdellovibrionota bacterium]